MRSAVPLFSTDWLPAVWPSFGVRPVSPEIIVMRASGRSSSSAAIWRERGEDALPELDLAGEHGRRAVGIDADPGIEPAVGLQAAGQPAAAPAPSARLGSSENATTMAPRPAVNSRRLR